MVQAADFWNRDNHAPVRWLDWPAVGCFLVEREMGAGSVIVHEVRGQDAAQVPLAEDEDVIQARASDRTDQALHERVLPGAVRRGENFLDPHALHSVPKLLAVDLVTIA